MFSPYPNVSVKYGDFYKNYQTMDDGSQDIIHIDIANNGDVYEFAFEHYLPKVSENAFYAFYPNLFLFHLFFHLINYEKFF